jgi:hypothetical protein
MLKQPSPSPFETTLPLMKLVPAPMNAYYMFRMIITLAKHTFI